MSDLPYGRPEDTKISCVHPTLSRTWKIVPLCGDTGIEKIPHIRDGPSWNIHERAGLRSIHDDPEIRRGTRARIHIRDVPAEVKKSNGGVSPKRERYAEDNQRCGYNDTE